MGKKLTVKRISEKDLATIPSPLTNTESTEFTSKLVPPGESSKYPKIKINVCVPGNKFSNKFLHCWTELLAWSSNTNLEFQIVNSTSSNINHGREALLMGDLHGDENQVPFKGQPYDFILFIDSDQIFTPQDVDMLLKADKEIIAGCIRMQTGSYAQGWYSEEHFRKTKTTYRIIDNMIDSCDHPFRVSLLGCGFTLIKKGVVEKIKFPWFKALDYPKPLAGYMGEDMSFFTRLIEAGVTCWVHPKVRIGHEKEVVI